MAEAVVSIALETLRDLLLEEAKVLCGLRGKVKALQKQLMEMKCLLKDADRRQQESESVVNWIAQIRELAWRSEDAIETYAAQVSSYKGRCFLHIFSRLLKERTLSLEISEIKSEVARVTKSMQEYGIRNIIQGESSTTNANTENQQRRRQTFPFEIEDCFVGKQKEVEQLVSLVVDNKEHRVVSICGMGGIGKTTIARKVYNHNKTKRSFESFAWVCITQKCQIRSVWEEILKQLDPQKRDQVSSLIDTELIGELGQIQKAKRCMIVLDDLWVIEHWNQLKRAFLMKGLESKILLTTRKRNVANMGFAFEIGLLNVDDGWELLKKKAFPHGTIPADFAIEENLLREIGEEMVRKCGYLPLVISLLGGVLSTRKSMSECELVNKNINTYLYKGEIIEEEEIPEVLNLSYEDIPYYLKSCFMYMAQFKEDQPINNSHLYLLWIAEGMISHENQGMVETLVDIAEVYFSELASRGVVQVEVEAGQRPKYGSHKLHDVVRELCLLKAKKDFGFQILNYQGGKFSTLLHECLSSGIKTRYLAIHFDREMELEPEAGDGYTIPDDTSKYVRSLQFRNHIHGKKIEFPHIVVDLKKFKLLRVLVFQGFCFAGRKLPRGIGNLIHLRLLHLQECELDELPSSISNLVYLYALVLRNSRNVRVPNIFKKMTRLKFLCLPYYDKEEIGNYRLKLDEGLDELESLVGFDSSVHELESVTRMKNLLYFDATVHDKESLSGIIRVITGNLKKLRFCRLIVKQGCQFKSMQEGVMILTNLFICPNLHDLRLLNVYIGKLLKECGNQIITSKLVRLWLFEREIEDDPMEILGKLPCLEEVRLFARSFMGEEMKCHALDFPRLKKLELAGLPNLREWKVEQGAMPFLSEIEIDDCPHLEMVPGGLQFIGTLQKLTISRMPQLAKRVSSEEGEDFDKVRHVPSIIIN